MDEIFAESLQNKEVMDSNGRLIGVFSDIEFNSKTGQLSTMLVNKRNNTNREIAHQYNTDKQNRYIVQTDSIQSIDDCIIVNSL